MGLNIAASMPRHIVTSPLTAKSSAPANVSFKDLLARPSTKPAEKTAESKPTEKAEQSQTALAFKDYMKKTPLEQMEEAWLKRHGYTKEEFKNLPPEEQAALRDQMAKELKEQAEQQATKPYEPVNLLV